MCAPRSSGFSLTRPSNCSKPWSVGMGPVGSALLLDTAPDEEGVTEDETCEGAGSEKPLFAGQLAPGSGRTPGAWPGVPVLSSPDGPGLNLETRTLKMLSGL